VLVAVGGVALLLFVPGLCTALLRHLGREWIVARLGFVLQVGFLVLVPAGVAAALEPRVRWWWLRCALGLAALLAGMPFAPREEPYRWRDYVAQPRVPRAVRQRNLDLGRIVRAFCKTHIPPGETILTDEQSGTVLASNHDCHVVAPRNSSNGVSDLPQRRRDLAVMLAEQTPWEQRRALLKKYGITLFRPDRPNVQWPRGHIREVRRSEQTLVIVLNTD
jgi:hypothetical protein